MTAAADLAQTLVIAGESGREAGTQAGTAETGLLADSVAINRVIGERHAARRSAQGRAGARSYPELVSCGARHPGLAVPTPASAALAA